MESDNEHITCSVEILNSKSKSSYTCHICSAVVKTNANLKAHLIKTHKIIESLADEAFYSKKKCKIHHIYHCPIENCKYHISTGKGVNKFSILKQHYNWVHVPHAYLCMSCNKSFGTAPALKYHEKNCGQRFICSICNSDFSEEKFLTYHQNHIHFNKQKNSSNLKTIGTSSSTNERSDCGNESVRILQPIYIPMIFPMNLSDQSMLNSMKDSTIANMDLLNKLRVFKPDTKDAETQVNLVVSNVTEMKPLMMQNHHGSVMQYPSQMMTNNNQMNCISYNWSNMDNMNNMDPNNGCQFYTSNNTSSRDYLNSCNASMQTVPYNSYDNFFNVETQTNLKGFVGRDTCMEDYGNNHISMNDDLIASLFTDVGCLKHETGDDLMRLADNHTQTVPFPIDMGFVDLNDIETQTNLQDFDDLLFNN